MSAFRNSTLGLALGLAVLSSCTEALAGLESVTYTVSSPSQKATDYTVAMTVPAFNPSSGSLLSVVISLSDEATINGSLTNSSASARNFSVQEDVHFDVSLGTTSLLDNVLTAQNSYAALGSQASANFGMYSLSGSTGQSGFATGPLVTAVLSGSPVTFMFSTSTNTTVTGGGGNTRSTFHTMADSTLTVTYNFIAPNALVPEPASLAMTALGGLMVGSVGYLRKRARSRASANA